ncbi:hypothetical protein [Clostridium ganghwense]|uniref:Uncharacterized protein n=1 Tax=Clostridium ganghwense TaxID=312089 RepID=A0ABT4CW51_9CLOT|nr:hypothetical protein [Clostridium ganghwense]MCY6372431.1 hypothetical protein [Clostridium ganghwense]
MFKEGMKLKVKFKLGKNKGFKIFRGRVIVITEHLIVVQGKNYTESFKFNDFKCGAAVLI